MEKMLQNIARQLNAMDEETLKSYQKKYLKRVQDFDASQEWEEASLILSLIQAVIGKNLMFNARLSEIRTAMSNEQINKKSLQWRSSTDNEDNYSFYKAKAKPHAKLHVFKLKK